MGRIRKAIAYGLLASALALGSATAIDTVKLSHKMSRDPDHIASVEINRIEDKINESLRDLSQSEVGLSSYGGVTVGDRDPKVKDAYEEINQAIKYLQEPIGKRIDPYGKIKKELKSIEKSFPAESEKEDQKVDYSRQREQLKETYNKLDEIQGQYKHRLSERYLKDNLKGFGGAIATTAGGVGGLVMLVKDLEKNKAKNKGRNIKILATFSFISIIISLIFLSSNLTGYSISNITTNNSNWFAIESFLIGVIFVLLYLIRVGSNKIVLLKYTNS